MECDLTNVAGAEAPAEQRFEAESPAAPHYGEDPRSALTWTAERMR